MGQVGRTLPRAVRIMCLSIMGTCILAMAVARIYGRPTSIEVAGTTIPLPPHLVVVAWAMPLLTKSDYQYVVERAGGENASRFATSQRRNDDLPQKRSVACRQLSFVSPAIASAGRCRAYALTSKSGDGLEVLVSVDSLPCGTTFEYWGSIEEFVEFTTLIAASIRACMRPY